MAEHLIQDTTLTGIADKIRSLLGLTGKMSPAQMQTNLTTEQANITAALAALAEKGVTVPDGSNSNALAGLIAAVEAGGGGKIATGTFTVAEYCKRYDITHNLGVKPKVVYYGLATTESKGIGNASNPTYRATLYCEEWPDACIMMVTKASSLSVDRTTVNTVSHPVYVGSMDETMVSIGGDTVNTNYLGFQAGLQYMWMVMG